MRLGVVMTGTGAFAAANVGVLRLLEERAIEIYTVCGMQGGAWTAALHVAGYDAGRMEQALLHAGSGGGRLFRAQHAARSLMSGKRTCLCEGKGIDRLLRIQMGERLLGLCARRGIFPCRIADNGKHIVFATNAYACGRTYEITRQATVGFAARAAMGNPPFLSPLPWAGSWLLAEEDAAWAAQQLIYMGADRVLILHPCAANHGEMDALELAAAHRRWMQESECGQSAMALFAQMPAGVHALDYHKIPQIMKAGYEAAQAKLDAALRELGMTQCRILPFRARVQLELSRR